MKGRRSAIFVFSILGLWLMFFVYISNIQAAAPNISSLTPANARTGVASTSDLLINFDTITGSASGNIYIKKMSDDSIFETIVASSAQVTAQSGSGSTTFTIDPSGLLGDGIEYYVEIDAGAFVEASSSDPFAGISGTSTWNFISLNRNYVIGLLHDVYPGGDSWPNRLTTAGDQIFFKANTASGYRFFRTDGTVSGLVDLAAFGLGAGDMYINVFGNKVVFRNRDATYGSEYWISDGTVASTSILKDINTGTGNSNPSYLGILGDELFFSAYDSASGTELWKTDGTESGTVMVKDINPSGSSGPSNGVVYNNELYFEASDGTNGYELWKTDGTESGTEMVADINTSGNSSPSKGVVFDGSLYFNAADDGSDYELWKTDGTASGTIQAAEIDPDHNANPGYYSDINIYNNELYFDAYASGTYRELWKYSTTSGASMVKDIYGLSSSDPEDMIVYNGYLFFEADDGSGSNIWKTDGTESGTYLVKDLFTNNTNSYAQYFAVLGDRLYLAHRNDTEGLEVFQVYKRSLQTLAAPALSAITTTSASASSTISDNGNASSTERGFVWSTSQDPTLENHLASSSESGSFGISDFSTLITGLSCGTTYYIRSYATNFTGTGYSDQTSFSASNCSCPSVAHASAYNSYPTCGASACESGYVLSGSGASAVCVQGSSGGIMPLGLLNKPEFSFKDEDIETPSSFIGLDANEEDGSSSLQKPLYEYCDDDIVCTVEDFDQQMLEKRRREAAQMEDMIKELIESQKNETRNRASKRRVLEDRLAGRILIQAEANGEAWYLNPEDNKRYFLGRPIDMFNVMRAFGLGAKHEYIAGTEFFPEHLSGKILLDVEDLGRAYYINPIDRRKYYLACPSHAFYVVKHLGLGISDSDLSYINAGLVPR
ncbi:hypothetical protein GF382_00020 [Candidatus Falkowbacteria bacterium]|nr:hypothetical protein [Candidatus Falkowbacteria bacterium]